MSNVGNSGFTWDLVSVLGDAYNYMADCSPVQKAWDWAGSGIIGRASAAVHGVYNLYNGVNLVNPLILKPLTPLLNKPQKHLIDGIAEFENYEFASKAILTFERQKKAIPAADYRTLEGNVLEELGPKKAADLLVVARQVMGPIPSDQRLMEEFFTNNPKGTSAHILQKQDEILARTFQQPAAEALGIPSYVKLSAYRNAVVSMLNFYSDAMKAPVRQAGLIDEFAAILYKGTAQKEPALNDNPQANDVKNTLEWKKMAYKEAGVTNGADFLNKVLDFYANEITENYLGKASEAQESVFLSGAITSHIKIGILKFINNIANNNIDDIKANPNGKTSKVLPANIVLAFSKLLNTHKNELRVEVAKLRERNLSDANNKVEYQRIFKGMSSDLVKMLGVDPLEDLDVLDNLLGSLPGVAQTAINYFIQSNKGTVDFKKRLWEHVENKILPEVLGEFYFSLTQWEAEKAANEKIIEERSEHGLGALEVATRLIVEKTQNYLALNTKKVGNLLKDGLVRQFEEKKSTAGDAAAELFKSKENASAFQDVLGANLPILAKDEAIADTLESVIQPTVIKLTSELLGKIGKIEDSKGSDFFVDVSLNVFQQFIGHMKNINGVRDKVGTYWSNNAVDIKKSDMAAGLLQFKNDESKGKKSNAEMLVDKNYLDAKKKLYEAKENLESLKNIRFKAASAYNNSKSKISLGNYFNNYLTTRADEAIKNVKNAKIAVKAAEKEFAEQTKIKHARPMGLKILQLLNVTKENLPLPKDQESLRNLIWESLTEDILPAALQNMVETITDKDMVNSSLESVLGLINESLPKLAERDLVMEGVDRHLKAMAKDHNQYPGSCSLAKQILELTAKGEPLDNSIRQIMAANPTYVELMKKHFKLGCGALPHVNQKFLAILTDVKPADIKDQKAQDAQWKKFDTAVGDGVKEFLDVLPNQTWMRHINLMSVDMIRNKTSDAAGKMVREKLGQWTFQKVIDKALENVATSKAEGSKWEKGVDGKMVLKKPKTVKEDGYTRDFHLPLTPEAEREYKIKQVLENKKLDDKVQKEMTTAMSLIVKGMFKSIITAGWQWFLDGIYNAINYLFSERFPKLCENLKKLVSFCLEKLFAKSVQAVVASIEFVVEKPFLFIMDRVITSRKAAELIKWSQMNHVHDEFLWDAMDTAIDKTNEEAAKIGA